MGRCTKNIHAQAIASQWFDSGMTQAEYARQNNLSIHITKILALQVRKRRRAKKPEPLLSRKVYREGTALY